MNATNIEKIRPRSRYPTKESRITFAETFLAVAICRISETTITRKKIILKPLEMLSRTGRLNIPDNHCTRRVEKNNMRR
jgi:hypothetical protein